MTILDMKGASIGISCPMYAVPELRISRMDAAIGEPHPFTFEDVLQFWPSGQIEQELVFEFLSRQIGQVPSSDTQQPQESESSKAHSVYIEDSRSTCTMAVDMAQLLIAADTTPRRKIETLIYYSSTMSTKTAWSTPCRLQSELRLKGSDAFAVSQKGAICSFAALQVAASMLLTEEPMHNVLLVGSERLIPPYQRCSGSVAIQSDSASAMFVSRTSYDFQLCTLLLQDPQEVGFFPGGRQPNHANDLADRIEREICELLNAAKVTPEEIALVLPAHLNDAAATTFKRRSKLPQRAFFTRAPKGVGSLGSSDLAADLSNALAAETLQPGDLIVTFGLSGEYSVGCSLLRYLPHEDAS